MDTQNSGRDIIVMGGSAGAVQAMSALLSGLPADLPAAVFVVVHTGQSSPGLLADILSMRTSSEVRYPKDRDPIELGTVYIAPPDRHLLVKAGEVRVIRGPKENNFRPALDPLFRTAAYSYGNRVIGVVLSGMLDDGTHGLMQIKQQGGVTIAQTPDEALEPSMPRSAIERVGVDYVRPAAEIGALLDELIHRDTEAIGPQQDVDDVAEGSVSALRMDRTAPPSPFICPECGGALWQVEEGETLRYRCHVGHGFTADTLHKLQSDEVEQSLWSAVRVLEEQAELQERMAERFRGGGNLRQRFLDNSRERQQTADLIRSLVTGGQASNEGFQRSPIVQKEYGARA